MENIIQKHRAFVAGQIEKSFGNDFHSSAQEVEKAYNVGDEKDFNGRTYYVHGLNAKGQPLWRLKDKKTKSDNEKKFKEDFKDASDDVLQKIVEGKIQAGDQERKWATDIINERKKSGKSEAAAKKIIDLLTTSSSKYTDIKKVVAFKTDKGNWAIDYDGANTGIILNGSKLSERELKAAGVKIEKPANDPRDKIAQDAGFKDYEEMRGYQNYVTSKNLLKKSSMQAKTKEGTRKKLEADVAKYEKEYADVIKRIAEKKGAKSNSAAVKIDETTIDQAEYDSQLKQAKQVDDNSRSMAKNIIQGNIDKTKKKLQETISSRPGAKATIDALQKDLTKFVSQKKAVEDAEKEIAAGKVDKVKKWEEEFSKDALRYLNEDVKYGTIKDRYGEEAEKVAKRILAKRKKERKDFIDSAPHDFTEEQVQTYLSKYNLQSEPSAVVKNKWNTLMGRIGSTSATISVGKGKFKEFSTYDAPDWRPIGDYHYSTMGWNGKYIDIDGTIQSWDDVKNALSETENMTIHIYKHPKQ